MFGRLVRSFRYRLWHLLLAMFVIAGGVGWFSNEVRRGRDQQERLRQLEGAGVAYDFQFDDCDRFIGPGNLPGPDFLHNLADCVLFADAVEITFPLEYTVVDDLGQATDNSSEGASLDVIRRTVELFPALRALRLEGPQITDASLAHVAQLHRLRRLRIEGSSVTDKGLAHLASMPELREILLEYNQISNEGIDHLATIPQLHRLTLRGPSFNADAVASLTKLKALQFMEIEVTSMDREEMLDLAASLQQRMPECDIVAN